MVAGIAKFCFLRRLYPFGICSSSVSICGRLYQSGLPGARLYMLLSMEDPRIGHAAPAEPA